MTEATSAPESPAAITSMRVLALFAADHVALTPDAKMYVNGGFFSLLRFAAFPAILPSLGIGAVLELPFQDTMREHTIRIGLRAPDGQELAVRVEAQFRAALSFEAQFGDPGLVPFGVTVTNVELPAPGVYQLVLWFDNVEQLTYRIRAIQTPMAPAPGPNLPPASPPE
jgi:hypothetical protein